MKIVAAVLGLGLVLLAGGCFEQTSGPRSYVGPLLRYHFAGRSGLPTGTNAARFKEIDSLATTAALRADIAQKFASAALPFWRSSLPAGATDQSPLLKPLLEDLLTAEAFLEVRGAPGNADLALAVAVSDERGQLWDKNLRQLAAAWKLGTPRDLSAEGFKGWELKKTPAPDTLQVYRAGKWTVVGLGNGKLIQLPLLLADVKKSGRPVPALSNQFIELAADLPALRPWFSFLSQWPLPPVVVGVSGRGDGIRTEVRFQYSGRIPWTFEPWKIPTNVVSEPLTSFTMGQGLAPFLKQVKGFADLGLNPLPNQFCSWGLHNEQCRMNFAVPVPNATNAMQKLSLGVPRYMLANFTNLQGRFLYGTNRSELLLSGVPWIAPMLHPVKDGKDEYLMGGIFPLSPKHTPVPDELFAQVRGRTNLLYYDWEITEHRLNHGKQFYQLASILNSRRTPNTNTASKRWLSEIGSKLGNTATEISQAGPQELVLVRRSHVGFTGFELATLSLWLDTPGFPFEFDLPAPLPSMKSRAVTNSPAARAPAGPAPAKATITPLPPKR